MILIYELPLPTIETQRIKEKYQKLGFNGVEFPNVVRNEDSPLEADSRTGNGIQNNWNRND
jgi:hypothetical protein